MGKTEIKATIYYLGQQWEFTKMEALTEFVREMRAIHDKEKQSAKKKRKV